MNQTIPNLHCEHHTFQHLSIADVIFGEDYLLDLAVTSGFYNTQVLILLKAGVTTSVWREYQNFFDNRA